MSEITAPVGDVTMPIRRGIAGIGRFRAASNSPSSGQLFLQLLKRELQRAVPLRLNRFDDHLHFAASLIQVDAPAHEHSDAVLRLEFQVAGGHLVAHALNLRGIRLLK